MPFGVRAELCIGKTVALSYEPATQRERAIFVSGGQKGATRGLPGLVGDDISSLRS